MQKKIASLLADKLEIDKSIIQNLLESPTDLNFGHLALPCFGLAKIFHQKPQEIAAEIKDFVDKHLDDPEYALIEEVKTVKAYVNFYYNLPNIFGDLSQDIFSGDFLEGNTGQQRAKVMIEFSQPNTHKSFHVGHLRNVCLGDALVRIFQHNGYLVVSANYIGDSGAHIAKFLWYYDQHHNLADDPPPKENQGAWLGKLYTQATRLLSEADDEQQKKYKKEISEYLKQLENGDARLEKLWQQTRNWSLENFDQIYKWLNIKFDHVFYESEVEKTGREMVNEYLQKGIFKISEGAVICDLSASQMGAFLVLKSDGTSLYATKDLSLAKQKFEQFKVDFSYYVVGSEQSLYFQQLFKTLEMMGFVKARHCRHVNYELVMLPQGKMSSRQGNVVTFEELKTDIIDTISRLYLDKKDWSPQKKVAVARAIALASLKYGMLSQGNNKRVVFEMEKWLDFEGETGAYLLYSHARICGIIRKLGVTEPKKRQEYILAHPAEKVVIYKLMGFNQVLSDCQYDFSLVRLCQYLYELCKEFNRFYHNCPVKDAEQEVKESRLNLLFAVKAVLASGLRVLGIEPLEEM